MTEETPKSVSEMIRITSENSNQFFQEIADHIDYLESTIASLQAKILQYEELDEKEVDDHK